MAGLAKGDRGGSIQVLEPGDTQVITVSSTHANSTNITSTNVVRLVANTDIHVEFGSIATVNSMFMAASVPEYFEIAPDNNIFSAVVNSANGIFYVTEMK